MTTRTFKIPPDFLSCESPDRTVPAAPADPFSDRKIPWGPDAAAPPHPTPARQVLEATGITFPEGASASFNPVTSTLTVTNTQENLELTAAFMAMLDKQAPANVAFTLTVVEGPGELIREANAAASKSANAEPALATLLNHAKQADSTVRVVGDAFLETKSGTRATVESVLEHGHVSEFRLDAKSQSSIDKETQQAGLTLEIEPTVGADGTTVEITFGLRLNAVPPVQRQVSVNDPLTGQVAEFPVTDVPGTGFVSSITTLGGHTKLLGVTKPTGTPKEGADTLWAAFLTTALRQVEALPVPQPKVAAPATVPPGMIFATLPVPDGLFASMLSWPRSLTLQSWLSSAGITFPAGASTQQKDGLLHLINTPENIGLIAALVDHELGRSAKTVAFTLHTLEAPAALLRDLTRQTLATADDAAMLTAVEAAAARGEARFINSAFVETKSGTRAVHAAAREHTYVDEFRTNDKGRLISNFETRSVGSRFEAEPTIRIDGRTVELTLAHELHPTAPMLRHELFRAPASQQRFELPVTDFHMHKTVTGLSVSKGGTKLISLNKPTGREDNGMLWATFLKCDVVPQVAVSRHLGHEPAPELQQTADPKAWNTRTFKVPPDFLSIGGEEPATGAADPPADPFAASPSAAGDRSKTRRKSARQILEAQGISFPEGAMASFNPALATLFIRNTNENLDQVEAFLDTMCVTTPKTLAFTTHVLQGPAGLLRRLTAQAATKGNHRAELEELLAAVKAGTVQHLDTARIETKSGTRATTRQGMQHRAVTSVSVNEKHEPVIAQQTRHVGLQVELEPTIGADGITVELTLVPEFHTAPPFEHREHLVDTQGRRHEFPLTDYHTAKITTGLTLCDGTVRMFSLHKPTGKPEFEKEDVLQVMFITCDILSPWE
ncbi:hypothetical protein [Prosthecobacter sp.]